MHSIKMPLDSIFFAPIYGVKPSFHTRFILCGSTKKGGLLKTPAFDNPQKNGGGRD
ncbi:hypothetical protein [Helicobacter sp. 16-1353]|uniref:hypothetical protein n=1 Tax=Helicobacter sp. 16-1353 TaxID=2004996 RepID=UPI0015EE872A|nr:hypothetical protein [Helicobacter sp. 16-1353]